MGNVSAELKVGLFVIISAALVAMGFVVTFNGVRPDEQAYRLHMSVGSADGLYTGSHVRIAGVEVGSVDAITLSGDRARVTLRIRAAYRLPVDSTGELKASGLLGDYYVRIFPGIEDHMLADGDVLATRSEPGDIDTITRNLEAISDDISEITKVLREVITDRNNVDHVESTLANVDALTEAIKLIAEQNRHEIREIVSSVARLTKSLEGHTEDIGRGVKEEVDRLQELTAKLDTAAGDVASITGKVDRGEGTIGALVNDRETIDALNDTIDNINLAVKSFVGLRPELYYTGRFYFGSQPRDLNTFYYGNPMAWSGANTIGINLRAYEDFWYNLEIVDHPQGVISQREVFREATGTVESRWIRDARYRFTFQINKRWGNVALRLGVKESGGGVGATVYAVRDRFQMQLDVFDFFFGSYPAIQSQGIPNTRLLARYEPIKGFYFEAGAEQMILGAVHGFGTGFAGVGFHFTDENLRWLFTGIPAMVGN